MASWQLDLLASHEGSIVLPPALCVRAEKLLAEALASSVRTRTGGSLYGQRSGNCVELVRSADGYGELWARIDARRDDDAFLSCLVLLMLQMECDLYVPELGRTVPAQRGHLNEVLKQSTAWSYAINLG